MKAEEISLCYTEVMLLHNTRSNASETRGRIRNVNGGLFSIVRGEQNMEGKV